jgi:hypothetical protein
VNGGSDWKDITPLPAGLKRVTIEHAFFRDTSEGWVLVSHKQETQPGASRGAVAYEIAHTGNGGTSWSFAPLKFPKSPTEPWRGRSKQILLNQVGWEARKSPAVAGVFFLDFPFYRTNQELAGPAAEQDNGLKRPLGAQTSGNPFWVGAGIVRVEAQVRVHLSKQMQR